MVESGGMKWNGERGGGILWKKNSENVATIRAAFLLIWPKYTLRGGGNNSDGIQGNNIGWACACIPLQILALNIGHVQSVYPKCVPLSLAPI